jgi:hypothetical protein
MASPDVLRRRLLKLSFASSSRHASHLSSYFLRKHKRHPLFHHFSLLVELLVSFVLISMNSISQDLILTSDALPTIPVRQFTRRHAGVAARLIAGLDALSLGISIKQSASGTVELLALATRNEICLISLQSDSRSGLLPFDEPFEKLLRGDSRTIVGFGMARMAVHLFRGLQYRVRGVDLSTLCSGSTRNTWRPSKLVVDKLSQAVNQSALDNLWDRNDMQGIKDVCLRAWISARHAVLWF